MVKEIKQIHDPYLALQDCNNAKCKTVSDEFQEKNNNVMLEVAQVSGIVFDALLDYENNKLSKNDFMKIYNDYKPKILNLTDAFYSSEIVKDYVKCSFKSCPIENINHIKYLLRFLKNKCKEVSCPNFNTLSDRTKAKSKDILDPESFHKLFMDVMNTIAKANYDHIAQVHLKDFKI